MDKLKKLLVWVVIGGIVYFFLSFHIVFVGGNPKLLRKSRLTLNYTFYSTQGKTNASIMAVDDLREDGIGELLMDLGRMTEGEYDQLMERYE